MQYEVKESGYGVTITSAKFDVVITPEAPLQINMSESAKIEVPQAINYIKSGEAEINAATDIGISRISSTVTDGLNQYNANATAKTNAYNDNAADKLGAYNLNAQNLTTAFDNNASDKTTAFNNNATSKTGDFNTNAINKTNAFNQNATDKTTAFNDNAAIKQAAVDASAAEAKQWAIGDPSEPTGNSAKYWANQAAGSLSGLESRVTTIESKIPAQASSSNQLADKNFVNSSIATNTANFIGTFNSVAELEAYTGAKDDNDYAFVISTDAAGNTLYNRYKWNGTAWLFEYALNNSSFTANQWAAINSGATTANIGQIATNTTAIAGKQDIISDLTTIRNGAAAGATALQPADLNNTLAALYPVGSIYIGTQATCPLATLISGSTWELVSAGRVLQGADSGHAAGTTIAAGLPNITGEFSVVSSATGLWKTNMMSSGAFYPIKVSSGTQWYVDALSNYNDDTHDTGFDASRSSAIYGNSTTVQPPAYCVNIWRRTA
jgi:hypothetical protein